MEVPFQQISIKLLLKVAFFFFVAQNVFCALKFAIKCTVKPPNVGNVDI